MLTPTEYGFPGMHHDAALEAFAASCNFDDVGVLVVMALVQVECPGYEPERL